MSKITVASTAGFCFGVNRAVSKVKELLQTKERVCTLGPIIHNAQVVNDLTENGVVIIDKPSQAEKGSTVVIRSHGVSQNVKDEIDRLGLDCFDATCPFVAKIHRLVSKASSEGKTVLIAGDKNHPEVIGIQGHCNGKSYIFKNNQELVDLSNSYPELVQNDLCIVAQTTFDVTEWKNCLKTVKKVYTNANFFDTICNATSDRQAEAEKLAKKSDLMLVIGGKNSSNTLKLYDICKKFCNETYLAETAADIPPLSVRNASNIGITAGASTPASIIKEVLEKMSEILKTNSGETSDSAEQNFEEMLEESLKNFNTDEKVRGVVVGITPNEVSVDVGRKQAGFIPLDELSNDPTAKPEDIVKIGDEVELLIMRTNDQEGTIMLSKKRIDSVKGWEVISSACESGEILNGVVTEIIKGGLIAVSNGIRVFVPASQATLSRFDPIDELLKKNVKLRIIEVNRGRKRAVGSIRSVLKEEKAKQREAFWSSIEVGKTYVGVVKSLTSYGAFVDIGGIDGMIHISELSWTRIKHPSEIVNVGDTVEVYVKDFDAEKGTISLGFKKAEDNPWEILKRDYPVGTVTDVTVVGMTEFGAFARILPGIDGLIHISQIANRRIDKPQDELSVGQVVKAKITAVDLEKKRISLSIRALLEEEAASADEAASEEAEASAAEE